MVSVSTPCFWKSSVMSSSSLPVEDGSEESEDFRVPFKASAFKDMVAPVLIEVIPIDPMFGGRGLLRFKAKLIIPRVVPCAPGRREQSLCRAVSIWRTEHPRTPKEFYHASCAYSPLRRAGSHGAGGDRSSEPGC